MSRLNLEDPARLEPPPNDSAIKQKEESSACIFGAGPIVRSIKAIQAELSGVRKAKDMEHVHRMRVASRRLRSALAIFQACLPVKKAARWIGEVRNLTRALGTARDTDVQLALVRELTKQAPEKEYKPGLRRLILRLKQQRSRLQERLQKTIQQVEGSSALANIASRFESILSENNDIAAHDQVLYSLAYKTITARLNDFLAYEVYIRRVEYKDELHAMRIAAKKLRYTLEILEPLYPAGLSTSLQAARKTQQLLGEIHDCDVWIEFIPHFLEKELQRMNAFYGHAGPFHFIEPGLGYFLENRKKMRIELHREFLKCWQKWRRQEIWLQLRETTLAAETTATQPLSSKVHEQDG
jgi:CHAD domain-containing protein